VRMLFSLMAAWVVGSLTFALAWVRFSDWESSSYVVGHTLVEYGTMIGMFVIAVGLPLAFIASRLQFVRWWSAAGIAAVFGALLGHWATAGDSEEIVDFSFSPWHRSSPGYIRDYVAPGTAADVWGSVAFGAIVGGLMGLTFWYFYARLLRPNKSLERTREG
jgi:hypothetical protein